MRLISEWLCGVTGYRLPYTGISGMKACVRLPFLPNLEVVRYYTLVAFCPFLDHAGCIGSIVLSAVIYRVNVVGGL